MIFEVKWNICDNEIKQLKILALHNMIGFMPITKREQTQETKTIVLYSLTLYL